jgi:hypothetical protein
MMTETTVYWTAKDAYGDEALWSGRHVGDEQCDCVIYRRSVPAVVWGAAIGQLVGPTAPVETPELLDNVRHQAERFGLLPAIRFYRTWYHERTGQSAGLRESRVAVERICAAAPVVVPAGQS